MRRDWIANNVFCEEQSMYLEIAKKQFNGDEYKLVKKQYFEGLHPESRKYDEIIIKNKRYDKFNG